MAFVVAAAVAGTLVLPAPADAGHGGERASRMLVLSLPHVTWSLLDPADTPNLDRLLEDSAVADLSVRVTRRKTSPATGYTTMGAGTRAVGTSRSGLALGPDETFEGERAEAIFERRMGLETDAEVLVLSVPDVEKRNDALLFGAEVGAFGEALKEAGHHRAVIGNADRTLLKNDGGDYDRQVAMMLMDRMGRVPGGRVDRGLLERDPEAGYGIALDHDRVEEAFLAEWRDGAVVAVEGSDIVRAESYRQFLREPLRDPLSVAAIEATDAVVGRLLRHVDLERDAVVVVAPASPRGQPRLTLAAVHAPGIDGSLLYSSTTRRPGFITIQDLAAGMLHLLDVERPSSMEGRPFETEPRGSSFEERMEWLILEGEEAAFRDSTVGFMAALVVGLQIGLAVAAIVVLRRGRITNRISVLRSDEASMRASRWLGFVALVLLGVLPMTYLAGTVEFQGLGLGLYLGFVFAGALALALAASALGGRDPVRSAGWMLGAILAVIVGNVVFTNSELQFNTVFGDSPIIAGRFTGINNLTFAQLAVAGVLLAVLLAHRLGGRRGAMAAIALMAALLVIDGHPAWGADVGGVLTLVPTFAYVGYRLWGAKVRLRTLVVFALATLVVIAAFGAYDLSRPDDSRTHLGRLLEQVDAEGSDALVTVVARKAAINIRAMTSSVWLLLVPFALALVTYLIYRRPALVRVIEDRISTFSIGLGGLLIAGVLGFALNDSGIAVPGMMFGVLMPVLVHLSVRMQSMSPEETRDPPRPRPRVPEPV